MRAIRWAMMVLVVAAMVAPEPVLGGVAAKKKCSAVGMNIHPLIPLKLPPKVKAMRQQILEAAVTCDIPRLEKLGLAGRQRFNFTFGKEKRPSQVWKRREAAGHQILAKIVKILRLPHGKDGKGLYVWPAAQAPDAPEESWEDLIPMYGEREVKLFQNYSGYTGLRMAIATDGDWLYCIDGD